MANYPRLTHTYTNRKGNEVRCYITTPQKKVFYHKNLGVEFNVVVTNENGCGVYLLFQNLKPINHNGKSNSIFKRQRIKS